MKKYIVTLSKEERDTLRNLTFKGTHKAQKILNAQILLGCDEGEYQTEHSTNEEIARAPGTSMRKIDRVKKVCHGRYGSGSHKEKRKPYI